MFEISDSSLIVHLHLGRDDLEVLVVPLGEHALLSFFPAFVDEVYILVQRLGRQPSTAGPVREYVYTHDNKPRLCKCMLPTMHAFMHVRHACSSLRASEGDAFFDMGSRKKDQIYNRL